MKLIPFSSTHFALGTTALLSFAGLGCEQLFPAQSPQSGAAEPSEGAEAPPEEAVATETPEQAPAPEMSAETQAARTEGEAKGLVETDLSAAIASGNWATPAELTVLAPEGAAVTEDYSEIAIDAGDRFAVRINEDAFDMAAKKTWWEENTVNKLDSWVIDEETVLLAKTKAFGKEEYHLLANITVGDRLISCKSNPGAISFTQEEAETMLTTCKTLFFKSTGTAD